MYREFIVPDDEEVFNKIGEWPEADENGARAITCQPDDGGDALIFSYDTLSRSVRVRWTKRNGDDVLDIYREGATRLTFSSASQAKHIVIEFNLGECAGVLEIQVSPSLSVQDRLLYV
ncbi:MULTISPECIES: hypothetical protein [unclassified Streptomyces]|uniref:hypothetical protein n=1 Tax=unclassified Streptomyces TaxID=2593676 RepID=UPI00332FE6D5